MPSSTNTDEGKAKSSFLMNMKKLEKENAALKQSRGLLSGYGGATYRIAESKELGQHVLIVFGQDGSEHAHTLVCHRRIGLDYQVLDDAFCVSDAKDIAAFMETKDHPGLQKIQKNISEQKMILATIGRLLIELPDGTRTYPGHTTGRDAYMDKAREYRTLYMSAKDLPSKEVPCTEWFMSPEQAVLECNYRIGLLTTKEYAAKVGALYMEIARHQPHTLDGTTQSAPPYLYGLDVKVLEQHLYNRLTGRKTADGLGIPTDFDVITENCPHPMIKLSSVAELDRLKKSLDAYKSAKKQANVSMQNAKQTKGKSKDEIKDLKIAEDAGRSALAAAKSNVRAADIKYGYKELNQSHPIIRAAVDLDTKMIKLTVNDISSKKMGTAPTVSK